MPPLKKVVGPKRRTQTKGFSKVCLICYCVVENYITPPVPIFQKIIASCSKYLHSAITKDPVTGSDKWDINKFQKEQLPFCQQCFEKSFELSELHDQFEKFQKDISDFVLTFSIKILNCRNQARCHNNNYLDPNGKETKMEIDISGFNGHLLGLYQENNFPEENAMFQMQSSSQDPTIWVNYDQQNVETMEIECALPYGLDEQIPATDHFLTSSSFSVSREEPTTLPIVTVTIPTQSLETDNISNEDNEQLNGSIGPATEEFSQPVEVAPKKSIRRKKKPASSPKLPEHNVPVVPETTELSLPVDISPKKPITRPRKPTSSPKSPQYLNGPVVPETIELSPPVDVPPKKPITRPQKPTSSQKSPRVLTVTEKYHLMNAEIIIPKLTFQKDGKVILPNEYLEYGVQKSMQNPAPRPTTEDITTANSMPNKLPKIKSATASTCVNEPLNNVGNVSESIHGERQIKSKLRSNNPVSLAQSLTSNENKSNIKKAKPTQAIVENPLTLKPSAKGTVFTCQFCSQGFRYLQFLQYHERKIHSQQLTKKTFRCSLCTKSFNNKPNLKQHMNIHDKKRLKCNLCTFSTNWNSSLYTHRLTHEQKRYVCKICSKSHNNYRGIRNHFKKEHPERNLTLASINIINTGEIS